MLNLQFDGKSFVNPCSFAAISYYRHTRDREPCPHSERPPTIFSAFICEGLSCAILQLNETKIAPKIFE